MKDNSSAQIKCLSTGPVAWTLNERKLLHTASIKENLLWIPKVSKEHRGIYLCKGTNEKGSVFYAISHLKVVGKA